MAMVRHDHRRRPRHARVVRSLRETSAGLQLPAPALDCLPTGPGDQTRSPTSLRRLIAMLVIDQLRKSDRSLRAVAISVLCGFGILAIGLWYVQIFSARHFRNSQV